MLPQLTPIEKLKVALDELDSAVANCVAKSMESEAAQRRDHEAANRRTRAQAAFSAALAEFTKSVETFSKG